MIAPILLNHNYLAPIGRIEVEQGKLVFYINPDHAMTKDNLLDMIGGAGIVIRRQMFKDGKAYIEEFEVVEWSLSV